MSDEKIILDVGFDEGEVYKKLQTLVKDLQNKPDMLNLKINFDLNSLTTQLNKTSGDIKSKAEKIGQDFSDGVSSGIIKSGNRIAETVNNTFKNVDDLRNSIRKMYSSMGDVSVSTKGINQVEEFTVQVKKADSTIDKFKYKLNGKSGQFDLINKNDLDNQIKDLEKLEKQLLKVEEQFHSLKFEPNTKQGNINSLKANIGNLKTTNTPIGTNDILNITNQLQHLQTVYSEANKQDITEGQNRVNFYNQYITKQKELNALKIKEIDTNASDNTKVEMQNRINQLNKELASMRENSTYYTDTVFSNDKYKNIMSQHEAQLKIKQVTYDDNQLLQQQLILYRDLMRLQKEEFAIKTKLVGKTDDEGNNLRANLEIVKEQQRQIGKEINNTKLYNDEKQNEVLTNRLKLNNELLTSQEQNNKKIINSQIKDLEKLEKQLLKVEEQFHSLKFEPNTKQGNINSLKENISNLTSSNMPIGTTDILNITQEIEKLGRAYENVNRKDIAEANRRIEFYDKYINKQKELNSLKLKEYNKNVGDNEKVQLETRIAQLTKELDLMRNNSNGYYKKEVSSDSGYKDMMTKFDYQMKAKEATYDDNQLLQLQKSLYADLLSLQKEEFSIKNKLVDSSDEERKKLEDNLKIVNSQQNQARDKLKSNNIINLEKENELLIKQEKLQNSLTSAKIKYNTEQQQMIKNFKSEMNTKIDNTGFKYQGLVSEEELNRIRKMTNEVDNTNKSAKQLKAEFKNIDNELKKIESSAKQNGNPTGQRDSMSLLQTLKTKFYSVSTWFSAGTLFNGLVRQFKQAVNTIIELDTEMVNLKKVTDETNSTYEKFLDTAHNIGIELGKTSSEVIKATTAWTKTGESLKNATQLSQATLLGSNVGDIDVDTMQKFLIAPLKAWNIEAKNAIGVVDILNNVSNKHAITVQDLGEAYTKSASVMALANNTLEESTALITSAQAKTQLGGDVIGNALNNTDALRV